MKNSRTPESNCDLPRRVAALAALVMAHGLATEAKAQTTTSAAPGQDEKPVELPELTVEGDAFSAVSSPKINVPLRELPQTVTVIPRGVLEEQGVTSLRDVLRNVPGITFQAGEGGGGLPGDTFMMRGFSATNDISIDGVRDIGAYSRDAFNLEQVEVTKGPASAYSGRGSVSGNINLVSKAPRLQAFRQTDVGLGTDDYRRASLDVNQPIGDPARGAAVRLNLMWSDAGVAGRDVVENKSWGIAPSLALGLGTPTRFTLNWQHLEQDNVPDYGLPWGAHTDPGSGTFYPTGAFRADPPIDQSNFYGLRDYDFEDVRSDIVTAQFERDISSSLRLRNVTRYGDNWRDSAITAPRPPNRQLQRRNVDNDTLANHTMLNAAFETGSLRHDVAAGLELSRESAWTRNSAQSTNQPQTNIRNPDPDEQPFGPMPAVAGNPGEAVTRTVAVYAFDTLRFSEQWQLNAGVRWDQSKVAYEQLTVASGTVTRLDRTDRVPSWRAGLVYQPRTNGSIYFGAGTSFRPASDAGNTGAGLSENPNAVNNIDLDPEKTKNYELGTKWDLFEGRLALNAALFRTEKTNAQTRNANNEPFTLDGRQRIDGVELGVQGALTDLWTVFATYTQMDSEISASNNPAEEDNNLANTPKSSASFWTTYQLPWDVTVGGGAQFMDSVFRNATNTTSVPSYWLGNLMAAWQANENLTLRLNVSNLADKEYVDRVGGGHYIPGPGRTTVLSASMRF